MSKKYSSVTTYIEDNIFEGVVDGQKVIMDTGSPEKRGQSPMELLLSAVSGCASVDVVEIIKKKRKDVTSFKVEVEANRRSEPFPKIYTDMHITFILESKDATQSDLEQAVELSMGKYCSVSAMLKAASDVTYSSKLVSV